MRSYEEIMADIVRDAHDDALRLEFAESIKGQFADWSEYIRLRVDDGKYRRGRMQSWTGIGPGDGLIKRQQANWERQIRKYMRNPRIEYDRGLPTEVKLDGGMFVEYGGHILKMFPIRHVDFERDEDGFDFAELFRCPHLASLESFTATDLTRNEREAMAASPFLANCAAIRLGDPDHRAKESNADFYDLLASTSWLRSVLSIERSPSGYWEFPGDSYDIDEGRFDRWGYDVRVWTPLKEQGRALEARWGYIPWLHRQQNDAHRYDAAYHRMRGTLPPIAPGTPVPYDQREGQ